LIENPVLLPGLDGRKMSKSYNNTIPLFLPSKDLKKLVNRIVTDSTGPKEPKNYNNCALFDFYKSIASEEKVLEMKERFKAGISWGEVKAELFNELEGLLAEPREKYFDLQRKPKFVEELLREGAARVRPKAQSLLNEIRENIGLMI
jgi:tryptophanyl-tRNA synthetase